MQNLIEKIFALDYKKHKGSGTTKVPEIDQAFGNLNEKLAQIASSYGVSVEYSIGIGRVSAVPWIRLFYNAYSPSAQEGVDIVYLFSAKEDAVYLTLNQGVTNSSFEFIKKKREGIQQKIDAGTFSVSHGDLDFGDSKSYGKSTIFYKRYQKHAVPDDSVLKNDVEELLEIYKSCKEKGLLKNEEKDSVVNEKQVASTKAKSLPRILNLEMTMQKIFFGAPGTGKSFKVNQLVDNAENVFRTTFHPDYDYAQFVGSYKPTKDAISSSLTYSFIPQVFAKAYVAAYKNPDQPVYLVIEEINRGNCAQIFGDIFQLLDRDDNGYSSYEIDADADFGEWLKKEIPEQVRDDGSVKLRLPPNFNILATMNTSDQSLFPMDSAFKRRFDWVYVPIKYAKDDEFGENWNADKFKIAISSEKTYDWLTFIEKVNDRILDLTESEDKQLGEFFIKPAAGDGDIISKERFMGKVMFYLWNEVCKDEHRNGSFFRVKDQNPNREDFFTYQDLYKADGDKKLIAFMDWIAPSEKSTVNA